MVTLSFSEAIIASLEQERAKVCELNNLRLYKIAQGLLWVGEGKALGEVGRLLGVSAKTVWNWLKRLMVEGLRWLHRQHYRGRGRKAIGASLRSNLLISKGFFRSCSECL